jgi:methionyl aminopeptidase
MIMLKSPDEIEHMRRASGIVAEILAEVGAHVRPGVSTAELDALAEELTRKHGSKPAFKGYVVGGRSFPATICISVNDEVVHGIPSRQKRLKDGDIIGLDFGVVVEGYYGDGAVTVAVGDVPDPTKNLMTVTREALYRGVEAARPGARVSDISQAVQKHVEGHGFSIVREFVGHGIGTSLHEDPQVPNYVAPGPNPVLREGVVLAIEPMVSAGAPSVKIHDDGWTASTVDGSLSAHFERSVAVTADGPWLLGGDAEVV